jgi:hypothetical protein
VTKRFEPAYLIPRWVLPVLARGQKDFLAFLCLFLIANSFHRQINYTNEYSRQTNTMCTHQQISKLSHHPISHQFRKQIPLV